MKEYKMSDCRFFLPILWLCICLAERISQELTAQLEVKYLENNPYLRISMKRPPDVTSLQCGTGTIAVSPNLGPETLNDIIYCNIPWSDSFEAGPQKFPIYLKKKNNDVDEKTVEVEFRLPRVKITCPNFVDGIIYARKNTTIVCQCHMQDPGVPAGQVSWSGAASSSESKEDEVKNLYMDIQENDQGKYYDCTGRSLLGQNSIRISEIKALPENFPPLTIDQDHVECDGIYPFVDVTLTCNNDSPRNRIKSVTLNISSEWRKHRISCVCKAVMTKDLSFESTVIKYPYDISDSKGGDESEDAEDKVDDDDDNDNKENPQKAQLPQVSLNINNESNSLEIQEGLNMSIECAIKGTGEYTMTIQRVGDTTPLERVKMPHHEITMKAACMDSGVYMCMATERSFPTTSSNHTLDVHVICAPVMEEIENGTQSYAPANDSTLLVEVDVAGYPAPNQFKLFKDNQEPERQKRSFRKASLVPETRYNSSYINVSPGHGKARLVLVGVSSNDTGSYTYHIINGIKPSLKYRFRVVSKKRPTKIQQDLGVNVGALVGGVIAAVILVLALIIVYVVIKKKDWLLAYDDEDSKTVTKVEIHQFPDSPITDDKPMAEEEEKKEKTEEDAKEIV